MTADQVGTLVDVWRSVKDQMDDIVGLTNAGQALLPNWPQRVREGGSQPFANELVRQQNLINQRRISLQPLFTAYQRYPNVGSALAQVATTGVFDRLYGALGSFSHEVQSLPAPLPENFENTLRPYAGELKGALDAMAQWATEPATSPRSKATSFRKHRSNRITRRWTGGASSPIDQAGSAGV